MKWYICTVCNCNNSTRVGEFPSICIHPFRVQNYDICVKGCTVVTLLAQPGPHQRIYIVFAMTIHDKITILYSIQMGEALTDYQEEDNNKCISGFFKFLNKLLNITFL